MRTDQGRLPDHSALKQALLNLAGDRPILFTAGKLGIDTPGVKPTGVDIQNHTDQSNRVLFYVLFNKRVPHPDYLAKYATAFYKMSRS